MQNVLHYNSIQMYLYRMAIAVCVVVVVFPYVAFAQSARSLPVAQTVAVLDASTTGGEVVVYDQVTDTYGIATHARDGAVYGVTAVQPALVFASNASDTMPVVTSGITAVHVNSQNGPIARGDVLTTSDTPGVAMRADLSNNAVFAIALEAYSTETQSSSTPMIMAQIGVDQTKALQESKRSSVELASSTATHTPMVSYVRGGIATVIVIGGLLFVLYSFRSVIAKGVVSIGRNPRARTSIIALSVGNIVFALILFAVVVFVAIGVLILPV